MQITTKFDLGDRVTDGHVTGEVEGIYPGVSSSGSTIYYRLHLEAGPADNHTERMESRLTLAPKKLTSEEAWLECALKIGWLVCNYGTPLYSGERSEIRHQAYQILGGNGVLVGQQGTSEHEAVKARLNDLIDRAVAAQEKE